MGDETGDGTEPVSTHEKSGEDNRPAGDGTDHVTGTEPATSGHSDADTQTERNRQDESPG